jgi:putative ABC transport system permease protein
MYAYCNKSTYTQLTGLPVNKRLIIRLKNVASQEDVKNKTLEITSQLEKQGIHITHTNIPLFNQHPHQWQLNTLIFVIGAIGFLSFLMGAVLVSQLMKAIMSSQLRQIGIMKSTGATRVQVFQIYLAMLLVIGFIAGIIAVPTAVATGTWFSHFVARVLNFNILTTPPLMTYILMMLASLTLPVLLSLQTILKGTRTSANAALTNYGITVFSEKRKTSNSKHSRCLSNLSGTFVLALRNSARNSRRLSITIFTMALGVAIFNTGFNVRKSLWNLLTDLQKELRYDIQVVLSKPISKDEAVNIFKNIPNIKGIYTWNGGSGAIQTKVLATDKGAGIIALPWNTQLIKPNIISGRWLKPSVETEVVLNQQAWELYGFPKLGENLSLVIGDKNIKTRFVGVAEQFELGKIFIDADKYDAVFNPDHLANTITFVAKDNEYKKVMELKKNLERAIVPSELNVVFVMSNMERVKVVYDHLNIILSTLIILSFLVLLVSAVGLASVMDISIRERTKEIGVMRAIGATPNKIYSLFANEGMIMSIASIVVGLLFSYPLSKISSVFFGRLMLGEQAILKYAFSTTGFIITLVATLLFGWIASRLPAIKAVRNISTKDALSYE